jgi:hypothetical protein
MKKNSKFNSNPSKVHNYHLVKVINIYVYDQHVHIISVDNLKNKNYVICHKHPNKHNISDKNDRCDTQNEPSNHAFTQ